MSKMGSSFSAFADEMGKALPYYNLAVQEADKNPDIGAAELKNLAQRHRFTVNALKSYHADRSKSDLGIAWTYMREDLQNYAPEIENRPGLRFSFLSTVSGLPGGIKKDAGSGIMPLTYKQQQITRLMHAAESRFSPV